MLTVLTPLEGTDSVYVGADCSMEALREYVRHVIGQVCLIFLVVLVIILAVSIFLADRNVIRKMNKLENRAYRDTLTGLQNRTAYYEYNDVLNKKKDAGNADYSILMIDINFLKRVNDTYGHEQGNLYLQGASPHNPFHPVTPGSEIRDRDILNQSGTRETEESDRINSAYVSGKRGAVPGTGRRAL